MSSVRVQLEEELRKRGVIPFVRFMETALYCPEAGYYEQICHTPGRRGDYFTSVSVGPVFGGLIAREVCRWMDAFGADAIDLVEGGAHDGQLARDILEWLGRYRPDCLERLRYGILEPSERRQSWQTSTLGELAAQVVWAKDWPSLGRDGVRGVVVANELLDAMPVVRLGWDAGSREWFEWGVRLEGEVFEWQRIPRTSALPGLADSWLAELSGQAGERLGEGWVVEVAPAALEWWTEAARALREGILMAFDYGWDESEGWRLASREGTLRAYRRHGISRSILDCAGEQDLTAHVNWGLIRRAGEGEGLRTVALTPQGRWLSRVAAHALRGAVEAAAWKPSEVRQFHTLTHPEYLGTRFQVLVQGRGAVLGAMGEG